jgi:hypothetical protein
MTEWNTTLFLQGILVQHNSGLMDIKVNVKNLSVLNTVLGTINNRNNYKNQVC